MKTDDSGCGGWELMKMNDGGWQRTKGMKSGLKYFLTGGVGQGGYDQEGSDYSSASYLFAQTMNQAFYKE